MNLEQVVISVDIQPLYRALEKEISIALDNVSNKDIAHYINASIIYSITKIPYDKPQWSMSDEMLKQRESVNNIMLFNQNYSILIYNYLSANVPYFFGIDNFYNVINKSHLNFARDDLQLMIKKISQDEWNIYATNPFIGIITEFDGYIPEKMRTMH